MFIFVALHELWFYFNAPCLCRYPCPTSPLKLSALHMPLSWTEIRDRAATFQKDWKEVTSEQAESQNFWSEFLDVFGVNRMSVAVFEKQVSIKRAGQDLDKAFEQATDYFDALLDRDLPRCVYG